MNSPRILLTGASGFLGKVLCKELIAREIHPRCFVRGTSDTALMDSLGLEKRIGDITDRESLETALEGINVVIHAAAVTGSPDPNKDYQVNLEGTRNLIEACRGAKVRRVIHVSTISVDLKKRNSYGDTKKRADELLLASGLDVTIIRPTLIFGSGSKQVNSIKKFLKAFPFFVPVIGNGQYRLQPVAVEDVAKIIVSSVLNPPPERVYYAAGNEPVSFDALLVRIMANMGIHKHLTHLPYGFIYKAVFLMEKFIKNLPMSSAQVFTICQDALCDAAKTERDFKMIFKSLDQIIKTVFTLERTVQ